MARRAGVTTARLVDAAAEIADREGLENLTLVRLARRLGVRPPSLFDHIPGRTGLLRALRVRSFAEQADLFRDAATGRSGPEALRSVADAYRTFARDHPGLYDASVRSAEEDSREVQDAARELLQTFLDTLRGFGIPEPEVVHAARFVRSTLHGFLELERAGGFGLGVDVDVSFGRSMGAVLGALERWPTSTSSAPVRPRGKLAQPRGATPGLRPN